MLSLDQLKPGDCAVISEIENDADEYCHLMELGLLEGTEVRFVKSAPLGDPIELDIRGYHLSIRRSHAKQIRVLKN